MNNSWVKTPSPWLPTVCLAARAAALAAGVARVRGTPAVVPPGHMAVMVAAPSPAGLGIWAVGPAEQLALLGPVTLGYLG